MTPFLSKISGDFDGLFGIFFGKDGMTVRNQAYDLGLTKKYKRAGDGAIYESTNLPGLGNTRFFPAATYANTTEGSSSDS